MPANIPAKKRFTKSRTVAGFMLLFSFHFHLVINWIKSGPGTVLMKASHPFIAQALGGWALRGVIGEIALHAVFSTSFHVAAVDDDSCSCADIDDFGIHSLYPLDADTGRPICACESTLLE